MDYNEAKSLMATHEYNVRNGRGRVGALNPRSKKIAYRTFLKRQESDNDETPETYVVEYLDSWIIHLKPVHFIINDCGWFSHSTHQRLNEFMPRGFHVSGSTPRWFGRPVGFVHTPAGVFPYDMAMSFTYDGKESGKNYSAESGQALHKVPAYVDEVLKRAFAGEASKDLEKAFSQYYENIDSQGVVRLLLRNSVTYSLVTHAADGNLDVFDGVGISKIVELLLRYGADIFKRPKTLGSIADCTEVVFQHGVRPPVINKATLRRRLRQLMISTLVNDLGFATQEWNRR